jgi:hypothetical protein
MLIAAVVAIVSTGGRLAFDSLVQRDAPDANRGRSFATFELRFQIVWVVGAVIPVLVTIPARAGFLIIAATAGFALFTYVAGLRAFPARPAPTTDVDPTRPDHTAVWRAAVGAPEAHRSAPRSSPQASDEDES